MKLYGKPTPDGFPLPDIMLADSSGSSSGFMASGSDVSDQFKTHSETTH